MRMLDCECGQTLQAATDDELVQAARQHVDDEHPDMDLSEEDIRRMVSEQAYEATDA